MFCWTQHPRGGGQVYCDTVVADGDKAYFFERLYGDVTDQSGVHVFNAMSLRWRTLLPTGPGEIERVRRHRKYRPWRLGHSAVLVEDAIYLWGGMIDLKYCYYSPEYFDMLRAFDVDACRWFKPRVSGCVPEGRCYHSACALGKVMYIHGGWNRLTNCTNDMYKLDTRKQTKMFWSLINTGETQAPVSCGHTATMIGTKMFVFGGLDDSSGYTFYNDRLSDGGSNKYYNTIRVFDAETNQWLNEPSAELLPEARWHHSAFAYNGELYIFGGHKSFHIFNDVWKFNQDTFSWKEFEPNKVNKPANIGSMYCCMVGHRVTMVHCDIVWGNVTTGVNKMYSPLYILDLNPSLKTLCKLAVIRHGLDRSRLPHNIKCELAATTIPTDKKTIRKNGKW